MYFSLQKNCYILPVLNCKFYLITDVKNKKEILNF